MVKGEKYTVTVYYFEKYDIVLLPKHYPIPWPALDNGDQRYFVLLGDRRIKKKLRRSKISQYIKANPYLNTNYAKGDGHCLDYLLKHALVVREFEI